MRPSPRRICRRWRRALVHLTGDERLIGRSHWPVYPFLGDGRAGGYSPEAQADIRERAKAAIGAYLAGAPLAPPPEEPVVRQMMDFVAGAEIPERYAPFLMEELRMGGEDPEAPGLDRAEPDGGGGEDATW